MWIQSIIILIGFVSLCSAKPNEFVKFACKFFDGMFEDCPKDCNQYFLPRNAIWVIGENNEDKKEFRCRKGYKSVINTACDNGNWNSEPTCQAVECVSGENIANSDNVTPSGTFGEEFNFACLKGFTGNGPTGTMTCGENGDWTMKISCEGIDDCVGDPCGDYGHCTNKVNGYECRCSPGFTGTNCETDIDDCVIKPCGDNGQCQDVINGYYCKCNPGFTGEHCEEDIDDCANNPCGDNGVCMDEVSGFNCTCNVGYKGPNCDQKGECLDEPEIINGTLDTAISSRYFGDKYGFSCNPAFSKNGNNGTVTCTETGEWDANITCEFQCSDEPDIPNGDLDTEITSRNLRDEYGFSCDKYFIKGETNGNVTCTETGKWEPNITCEDCFIRRSIDFRLEYYTFSSENLCKEKCGNKCDRFIYRPGDGTNCYLFVGPIRDFYVPMSLAECIQKCKNLSECLTMSHFQGVMWCILYSKTVKEVLATPGYTLGTLIKNTLVLAEKNTTCPSIL